MLIQTTHTSKSTSLTKFAQLPAAAASLKKPERQRGLWSFLTWSFFLSDVVAAGSFFGNATGRADEQDEQPSRHTEAVLTPSAEETSNAPGLALSGPEQQIDEDDTTHHRVHAGPSVALLSIHQSDDLPLLQSANKDIEPPDSGGGGGSGFVDADPYASNNGNSALEVSNSTSDPELSSETPTTGVSSAAHLNLDTLSGSSVSAAFSGSLNLTQILGFEVQLDVHGAFVSVEADLTGNLNVVRMVSTATTQGLEAHVKDLIGFDLAPQLKDLLPQTAFLGFEDQGSQQHPTLAQFAAENSALAQLTGLQGDFEGNLMAGLLHHGDSQSFLGPSTTRLLDQSAGGAAFDLPTSPVASILPDFIGLEQLQKDGSIASANAITFAAQPLASDLLFVGNHYTEYNFTLQSTIASENQIIRPIESATTDVLPAHSTDIAPDSHSVSLQPLAVEQHSDSSIIHQSLHFEELSPRAISV